MNKKIEEIIKNLNKTPGIYKFFDKGNKIIYIGKSINLFNRVNSYFNGKGKLNFAKQKMVNQINNIEVILTNNEIESLILETNLIKKHKPKYNILMKDDKSHIYIKITDEVIPQIIKTRIKTGDGTYFGPFISTSKVNNNLKIVKKIFGYRSCNIKFIEKNIETDNEISKKKLIMETTNKTKVPCIDFYIKRCSGPCLLEKTHIDEYKSGIDKIKKFFKGNYKEIIENLEEKMKSKAKELNFEEAQKIKVDIESIKSLDNIQIINAINGDYDVVNYIEKYEKFYIGLTNIRNGKITGYNNYEIENKLEEEKEDLLKYFLELKYIENMENSEKNVIFLTPEEIKFTKNLDIKIEVPKIGTKNDLLKLTYKNIFEYATKDYLKSLSTKSYSKQTMVNLLNLLGYKQVNKDIIFECNDISHFSGSYTVASRSIIENGKANNSKYKKFKIKDLEEGKIDDFGSLREIIKRRLKELIKTNNLPDLIIIDGGKGQLSSVMQVIEEIKKENTPNTSSSLTTQLSNIENKEINLLNKLQLVSIAKREEELFLPYTKEPILLKKDSLELRLIQKIRDEAHRFAITFNRDSRIKAMKKNILESLPGFGATSRKKILKKYGSVEALKGISKEELALIINKTQIETLENHGLI